MDLVYFSSRSQNTHRFVLKLEMPAQRIPINIKEQLYVEHPYVLVVPTYADNDGNGTLTAQVEQFLDNEQNASLIRGVIAGGNRNFGKYYAYAGDVLSGKYNIPLLSRFELMGTSHDVEVAIRNIKELQCRTQQ